jgi:DNA replicative helicase MCM subunit Mcm2 (Cdc46/Mcm family)
VIYTANTLIDSSHSLSGIYYYSAGSEAARATMKDPSLKCPIDPYMILGDKCIMMDVQTLKLQEAPDDVSIGEIPRHVTLVVNR